MIKKNEIYKRRQHVCFVLKFNCLTKDWLCIYENMKEEREKQMKKVVIIGAGPAGLTAAYELL